MMRRVLPGRLPSIHYQNVAGDVIGSVGSEKDSSSFQVMLIDKTASRTLGEEEVPVVLKHLVPPVGGEPARSDGIDLDVVQRPFARQVFGETDHSSLAG